MRDDANGSGGKALERSAYAQQYIAGVIIDCMAHKGEEGRS